MTMECATDSTPISPEGRDDARPIFLVGMMGVGKTTIGRHLAAALGREFVDLDHAIEARCGVRVATIFDIEGEEGFRRRETVSPVWSWRRGVGPCWPKPIAACCANAVVSSI